MRLLHTSDWHLGHELYGIDRTDEFVAMLLQMERMVQTHRPDVFLISGDIFDTAYPGSSVQTLFTNAMVALHNAHPAMTIVVTAGNHDSAARHEIFREPWRALNVYVIGRVNTEHPADHIISLTGIGHIVAVPYVHDKMMPEGFYQELLDMLPDDNLPVVMAAHTTVAGAEFQGHNTSGRNLADTIGNIADRSIVSLGRGYDYLALGHIHKAQFIHGAGHHRARYCGSPVQISFDETTNHSVSLVDIDRRGGQPCVTLLPVEQLHELITLPDNNTFLPWDEALECLCNYQGDKPDYIRLNVLVSSPLPDDRMRIINEICAEKAVTVCRINPKRPETAPGIAAKIRSVNEFQETDPLEIAKEYAEFQGIKLTDDMIALFREAYSQSLLTQ